MLGRGWIACCLVATGLLVVAGVGMEPEMAQSNPPDPVPLQQSERGSVPAGTSEARDVQAERDPPVKSHSREKPRKAVVAGLLAAWFMAAKSE